MRTRRPWAIRAAVAVVAATSVSCGPAHAPPIGSRAPGVTPVATASADAATDLAARSTIVLGRTVDGRPIDAIRIGDVDEPNRLLVVGCIHGDERAGEAIARRLEADVAPREAAVYVVESINPDGAAAGTRQNADGVDLNRNFPAHWRPIGRRGDQQYSGTGPLSEPESREAAAFIESIRPTVSLWFHQPVGVVDDSGGSLSVEQRYASMVGLPLQRLTRYPGSVATWENERFPGSSAFVIELHAGALDDAAVRRFADAALSLAG